MSEAFSNRRSMLGSYCSVSNYGDYRLNREDEENQFHSVAKIYNEKVIKTIETQKRMDMLYNYQIKNNEFVPDKDSNKKEEKVRKTRKDKEGRKFICGSCLLGYLSYPALYTHIKTKHNGQVPEGTVRGENGRAKKRGRPKNRKALTLYEPETEKNTFPEQLTNIVKRQQLKILEQFDYECPDEDEGTPNELQIKYFHEVLKILKAEEKPNLKLMSISLLVTTFLYNCKDFFDKDAFASFEELFEETIQFIDKNYIRILKDYRDRSDFYIYIEYSYAQNKPQEAEKAKTKTDSRVQLEGSYCFSEPPQYFPCFVEQFIREVIIRKQDEEEKKLLLVDFCNWLFQNKLSCIKLDKTRAEAMQSC